MDPGMDEALRRWRETRHPESLGELLKRQRDRAYSVALRFTGSSADAEDAVQDAFLKLMTRTHGFEDAEAFEAAVYRAVVQCALDVLKQGKRRRKREDATAREREADVKLADAPPEPEREELRALLREAVLDLGEDERAPVVLCYHQGLSVAQAARVLELPRETVRARLNRALGALRSWLGGKGKDVGLALLPALLWNDGLIPAPQTLCKALDACLPGRPCAQLPARPQPGLRAAPKAGWIAGAGVALAATACFVMAMWVVENQARTAAQETSPSSRTAADEEHPQAPRAEPVKTLPAANVPPELKKEEEPEMKKTLSAVVLAGVAAMPFTASAGEPNAEVTKVLSEIQARRAAKAEAEAKAIKEYQKRENREEAREETRTAAPGAPVVINIGEGK
ncbi:MAG: RNA polymerase sigma factor [Planctomycetes bacterium]|nr:RNA polymerase sigma factor [Planctomycetota bacterium]